MTNYTLGSNKKVNETMCVYYIKMSKSVFDCSDAVH